MSEEKVKNNSSNVNVKKVIVNFSKKLLIIAVVIFIVFFILVGGVYVIQKDDLEAASKDNNTYESTVNSKGETVYVTNNEADGKGDAGGAGTQNGASGSGDVDGEVQEPAEPEEVPIDEIAELLHEDLDEYIDASDEEGIKKVKYLLQAETITKTPYIESAEPETAGKIKFYRFNGEDKATVNEENRITYVTPEEYEDLKEKYTKNGDETIFKHFTLGDDGSLKIAYGTKETKNITSKDRDVDLTEEIIRQKSGDELYTGNYKDGFTITRYTIKETTIDYKPLVEQYAIPSNLLFSLLIQTRDIRFVEDIAKLAYETELAIGIYDNESVSYVDETYTYQKMLDTTISTYLSFNFSNITNPTITNSTISNLKVPYRCHTYLNKEKQEHKVIYKKGSAESRELDTGCLYIKNVTEDAITETSAKDKAKTFELKYRKDVTAKSSPTVGLILADTWIAKWSATYTKEENPSGPIDNSNTLDDEVIETYDSKESFLNAFNDKTKNDFSNKLDAHAEELKTSAIEVIYENQKGNISVEKVTASELTIEDKEDIIRSHEAGCPDCMNAITKKMIELMERGEYKDHPLVKAAEELDGDAKKHYEDAIEAEKKKRRDEADKQNSQNKSQKEKEFEEALKAEGTITANQRVTAIKYNVNIEFTSSTGRTSTTYKKDETVQRDDDGKKFSEIFNNEDYYKATQALKARIAWFWEYMEKNEDTERLIYVFKYLLNIATGTTDYIKDFDFETMFEKIFADKFKTFNGDSTRTDMFLLKNLLIYFEGTGTTVKEGDTTYYVAYGDSLAGGLATIGPGITTNKMDYFPEEYKGWKAGDKIPVEIVDDVYEKILLDELTKVKAKYSGITSYQAIAIASAGYNCGPSFYNSIQPYFNRYSDDKYGEKVDENKVKEYISKLESGVNTTTAISIKQELISGINCSFYKESWSRYVNTTTETNVPGLIKRRYIEWLVFQYGYFANNNSYYTEGDVNEIQLKIVEIAQDPNNGVSPDKGRCLGWVYDIYQLAGAPRGTQDCALCGGYEYGVSKDLSIVPLGAAVYKESTGTEAALKYGHVGIYIGDGKVIHNVGAVVITPLQDWINEGLEICWGWACEPPINSNYPITKGLIHKGLPCD